MCAAGLSWARGGIATSWTRLTLPLSGAAASSYSAVCFRPGLCKLLLCYLNPSVLVTDSSLSRSSVYSLQVSAHYLFRGPVRRLGAGKASTAAPCSSPDPPEAVAEPGPIVGPLMPLQCCCLLPAPPFSGPFWSFVSCQPGGNCDTQDWTARRCGLGHPG